MNNVEEYRIVSRMRAAFSLRNGIQMSRLHVKLQQLETGPVMELLRILSDSNRDKFVDPLLKFFYNISNFYTKPRDFVPNYQEFTLGLLQKDACQTLTKFRDIFYAMQDKFRNTDAAFEGFDLPR